MDKEKLKKNLKKTIVTGALTATATFLVAEMTPNSWQLQASENIGFFPKGGDGGCPGGCGGKGDKSCDGHKNKKKDEKKAEEEPKEDK